MTQPDYREKARALQLEANKGHPEQDICVECRDMLAQALHDAHLAGRREGIEEAEMVAAGYVAVMNPKMVDGIVKAIRALLRGGKDG